MVDLISRHDIFLEISEWGPCFGGKPRLIKEKEGLFIVVAANLAKKEKQEGLKLNYPEAVAIITYEMREMARRGNKTVPELEEIGRKILTEEDVMEGVASMIKQINIEATFPDGTKLVVIPDPIQPKSRME